MSISTLARIWRHQDRIWRHQEKNIFWKNYLTRFVIEWNQSYFDIISVTQVIVKSKVWLLKILGFFDIVSPGFF